jgi:hypothetical protein
MVPHAIFGDAVGYRTSVGAVIVATLTAAVLARLIGRKPGDVLDTTAVAIPLGSAIVRIGCFLAGCCQGIATSLPIGVALHADDVARHPVQLYESVLEAILTMIIARRGDSARPGRKFATSIAGLCSIRFVTEFVRDNDRFGGLSLAQWVVLPVGALCIMLLLSHSRSVKPRRVLTAPARQATLLLIGGLAIAALVVGLPALESSVLLVGAALIVGLSARKLQQAAPLGLAALALQMPAARADSAYPRISNFFGGGGNASMWDFTHESSDCEGGNVQNWTRHHSALGMAFEAGSRRQNNPTQALTIRAKAYLGTDQVGRAIIKQGVPPDPDEYTQPVYGLSAVVDADFKYFGMSLGATGGQLFPMQEPTSRVAETSHPAAIGTLPAIAMRFGKLEGVSFEWRFADESPMWAPAPVLSLAVGIGDSLGNRVRGGITEAGILLAGNKKTATGLEVMPTLVIGTGGNGSLQKSFSGGIMFRRWIRVERRPPGER